MMAEPAINKKSNTATWVAGFFGLGIVVSAAFITGFLTLPQEKPAAKKATSNIERKEPTVSTPVSTPSSVYDPTAGDAALAKLWSDLEPAKLAAITKDWKAQELARIVMKMRVDKQSELLAELPAERASSLSREIHRLSSNP